MLRGFLLALCVLVLFPTGAGAKKKKTPTFGEERRHERREEIPPAAAPGPGDPGPDPKKDAAKDAGDSKKERRP